MLEKRLLQIAILVFGLVPVLAGLLGMVNGTAFVANARDVSLDSHVRFLSGLLFGIGIGFWSLVPRIEAVRGRCRLLTAIVFIGGLARLAGLIFDGVPSTPMVLAIGMELAVTPLLCLWQARMASVKISGENECPKQRRMCATAIVPKRLGKTNTRSLTVLSPL